MPEDKIIQKLLEHDERLQLISENMATKADLREVIAGQDKMIGILKRLDQERVFTTEWIRRIEKDVERVNPVRSSHGALNPLFCKLKPNRIHPVASRGAFCF